MALLLSYFQFVVERSVKKKFFEWSNGNCLADSATENIHSLISV